MNGNFRMLKRGVLGTVLALVGWWAIFSAKLVGSSVTASWSYDYAPAPACSAARSNVCLDHFEVLDITDSHFVLIVRVPNPSPATGKVDNVSTIFKYGPPFGQRTLAVVAVGRDAQGQPVSSNPYAARRTVSIRPRAAVSTILN
jgi:hypothetical protein